MKRVAVFVALTSALLLDLALSNGRGFEAPQAEAATTTWIWPPGPGGYPVNAGAALERTESFLRPLCTSSWISGVEPDRIYQDDPTHTAETSTTCNADSKVKGI